MHFLGTEISEIVVNTLVRGLRKYDIDLKKQQRIPTQYSCILDQRQVL